jgi:peptidoglycan-N-acetylmuramic acid deacetylase
MEYGRLTTLLASRLPMPAQRLPQRLAVAASKWLIAILLIAVYDHMTPTLAQISSKTCGKPVYLTLDTGHMEVAPLMAQILNKYQVKATFFVANEKTKDGGSSLDASWGANFWKARAAEGHEFASHTLDHTYWKSDLAGEPPRFMVSPSAGPRAGQKFTVDAAGYCAQIDAARSLIEQYTGKSALPLYRAPGGKTSPRLLSAAKSCGYQHVGWADAGFLGDELSSEAFPNDVLLKKALKSIQAGDILMAHLGIWSRKDPWAPAVLEPLIVGLKARGLCFATLREHPAYATWIAQQPPAKPKS